MCTDSASDPDLPHLLSPPPHGLTLRSMFSHVLSVAQRKINTDAEILESGLKSADETLASAQVVFVFGTKMIDSQVHRYIFYFIFLLFFFNVTPNKI